MISANSAVLASLEPAFGQDLNGSGGITPSATIEAAGSTDLVQVAGTYFLYSHGGSSGPQLKFGGVTVVAGIGQFSGWHAIGAEQTAGGYQVVWKADGAAQYSIWNTDFSGNYLANQGGLLAASSAALAALEPAFGQDLNESGGITAPVVIESAGSTDLVQSAGTYFLYAEGSSSGPQLKFGGVAVDAGSGQFAGWAPIGAEHAGGGYQVVWKANGADQYSVWNTDSNGNYFSNQGGVVSGSSSVISALEPAFGQDLNGVGGITAAVPIETAGSTDLTLVAGTYFLNPSGSFGPQLKFGGTAVQPGVGQFAGWHAIGAEATDSGYQVAWKADGADQYTIWSVDGLGNYVSSVIGVVSGSSAALQSREPAFQQNLNGDSTIGIQTTEIEAFAATTLVQVAGSYYLYPHGGTSGPQLKFGGVAVEAGGGQFAGWSPIAAELIGGGYYVVWKANAAAQYSIWITDGDGNYLANQGGVVGASNPGLRALEPVFGQDLNGSGGITAPTVVESAGSTDLVELTGTYFLSTDGTASGPQLKFGGAPVTAGLGQFAGWSVIAAEQTAGGYQVVWKADGADQYSIWNTDSSGNYVSNLGGAISGSNLALLMLESAFGQDLNGSGAITPATVVESAGSTDLIQIAGMYFLKPEAGLSGPQLKYNGAAVTVGQFEGWVPISVEANGGGYRVAWKNADANEYKIWNTDGSGNYLSGDSAVSGASSAFQTSETAFQQDLNGDGTIGIAPTVIESAGATALTEVADTYFLGVSGPQLRYNGAVVTAGQFGTWTPIGAEAVPGGYRVAWKHLGTEEYKIWLTDSGGNYVSGDSTVMSGGSMTFEALEPGLQQDLNGDGTIGVVTTAIESVGSTTLSRAADVYVMHYLTSDVVLKYAGVPVTAGQFPGWTPVGADTLGNGTFRVAWKHVGTDEYKVWETDANGNYVTGDVVLAGSSYAFQSKEAFLGGQDVNGDGAAGIKSTVIENSGVWSLTLDADTYTISGTPFKYAGTPVTVGMFPGWTPIGAENGNTKVVWKRDGADEYRIWSLSGYDFASEVTVSGGSWKLQSLETLFAQDLNHDGRVGFVTTDIEASGATKLSRVADAYAVGNAPSAYVILSKDSLQVIPGQTGDWTPIGAEATVSGGSSYKVVWKLSGADQYKIWNLGSDGNYLSGDNVVVSGSAADIQVLERAFGQDLNGDGHIPELTVIETAGATKLAKVGNAYQLGLSGVVTTLSYGGALVTDQLDGWEPVAAELKSGGYYVVWKNADTGQFKIWATNAIGAFTYDYGVMSGSDWMLRTVEAAVKQDVNGDGAAGLPDSPFDITYFFSDPDFKYDLYVKTAAARWEQVITADLPSVNNSTYGLIDDVRIDVSVRAIDGAGGALAGGTPVFLRNSTNLTSYGTVDIDSADIASMAANGTLVTAVMHEMGHVLGIGSLWSLFGLVNGFEYHGQYALEAYRELSGDPTATFVPVESTGGSGSAGKHWSEAVFGNELMTTRMTGLPDPLSTLTIAALRDLGYSVNYAQAEAYSLPT